MNPSFVLIWSFADPIHPLVSHTISIGAYSPISIELAEMLHMANNWQIFIVGSYELLCCVKVKFCRSENIL